MREKEGGIFFVKIREPSEVKRYVLESLKDIVENFQRFERFKSIREEKLETISKLREEVKDLLKLTSSLRASLPETKLRVALQNVEEVKKKRHKAKKKGARKVKVAVKSVKKEKTTVAEKPKPMSELEKLESELSAIESKLNSLK